MKAQHTASVVPGIALILGVTALGFQLPIPGCNWKGLANVTFAGKCTESITSNAISQFIVSYSQPQTIITTNGNYVLTLKVATLNGTTCISRHGIRRLLGPSSEPLSFEVSSQGYKSQTISVPRNTILVEHTNGLNIVLEKK